MCGLSENNKYRKPVKENITAFKVFDHASVDVPTNYDGDSDFKFGLNIWDKERASIEGYQDQSGFQMFAHKRDAVSYACSEDFVCEVEIQKKHIAVVGHVESIFSGRKKLKAYEVTRFKLLKSKWNKKKTVKRN